MARSLTSEEIEVLASKKGVKRIAVENFLGTIDTESPISAHRMNLSMDAQLYKWNAATEGAIQTGISVAYGQKKLRIPKKKE